MRRYREYIRSVYQSWIAIFVATVGFVGSLGFFLPDLRLDDLPTRLFALVATLFASAVVLLVIKPVGEVLDNITIDEAALDAQVSTKILFPYEQRFLKPINAIANNYYGRENPDMSILKEWYEWNPYTLVTLADSSNTIIGYYDILPLKEEFASDFIAGKVSESDIRQENILSVADMRNARYLYFAGVAVKDYDRQINRIYSGQLLFSTFVYLKSMYSLEKEVLIFALATTSCGERLLRKLGYTMENSGHNRIDGTDLYLKRISMDTFYEEVERLVLVMNRVDYSSILKARKTIGGDDSDGLSIGLFTGDIPRRRDVG